MLDVFAGRRAKKKIENVEFAKESEKLKKKHPQLSAKEREALVKEKLGKKSKVEKAVSAGVKEIGKQLEPEKQAQKKKKKSGKMQTVKVVVEGKGSGESKKKSKKKTEEGVGLKDFGGL